MNQVPPSEQETFRAHPPRGEHRGRAGEAAHGQRGLRATGLENLPGCPPRLPEAAQEGEPVSALQCDRGQCEHFQAGGRFDGSLIHFLG